MDVPKILVASLRSAGRRPRCPPHISATTANASGSAVSLTSATALRIWSNPLPMATSPSKKLLWKPSSMFSSTVTAMVPTVTPMAINAS